jgi:hypothetical protein
MQKTIFMQKITFGYSFTTVLTQQTCICGDSNEKCFHLNFFQSFNPVRMELLKKLFL